MEGAWIRGACLRSAPPEGTPRDRKWHPHIHGVKLHTKASLSAVVAEHAGREIAFAMAFPPCTELSRAGARYWKVKGQADPHFQDNAAALVKRVDSALAQMKCPYFLENPSSSTLRKLWRAPDHTFEPCWFGGYTSMPTIHTPCTQNTYPTCTTKTPTPNAQVCG